MRSVSSACHLDSIFPTDLNVVVKKNQHASFFLELEVNTSAKSLVNDEDSILHLRNLIRVVEQLFFVIEQLYRKFTARSNLRDLGNQTAVLLLKEDEDWILHFHFQESMKLLLKSTFEVCIKDVWIDFMSTDNFLDALIL